MFKKLQNIDRDLFLKLNENDSVFWDHVMIFVSDKYVWIPGYLALIVFLIYIFRRQGYAKLLMAILAVGSADFIGAKFFKPGFERLRPCHDPELAHLVDIVHGCGGRFGFVSSHAATTFALAMFMFLVLPPRYRWFKVSLFIWAALISYSRIYLGVHYPGDVLIGALLGMFTAWLSEKLYQYILQRFAFFRR